MAFLAGHTVSVQRVLTQEDFNRFARLSGDDNPIHVDPEFAARTRFGKPVAHGMFLYGLIMSLLNEYFPGAEQISQDLMFPVATPVGERVTVTLRVIERQADRARIETVVTRADDTIGCQGEMWVREGAA